MATDSAELDWRKDGELKTYREEILLDKKKKVIIKIIDNKCLHNLHGLWAEKRSTAHTALYVCI